MTGMNANSDLKYRFTNVNGIIKKKSAKEDSFFYKFSAAFMTVIHT